ncbi:MAG: DUF262 domain-containing protein [Marinobacter sp.]|nr:DUF262 domain-containing protein [Marinobacter sp.]
MEKERSVGSAQLTGLVDQKLQKVHTQSLDLSFNELLDMAQNSELDITPEYQRLFQWSEGARSRFIESLLLEMPVPPIYVVEEDEGRYLLIDGLQRISSYLHFRGALEADHLDPPVLLGEKLILTDCDIVEEFNGKCWDDLGTALQIRLKRSFVRVEVIRRGSDPRFKYHMFKRLNTGGELLTDQQLRNCTIRLLNPTFNDFIISLSGDAIFQKIVSDNLSREKRLGAYDQELILRFFSLKNARSEFVHDVRDFLTQYMEEVSDPETPREFVYADQERDFLKTFRILDLVLGEKAFSSANAAKTDLKRGFLVYHFEAFSVGLQQKLDDIDESDDVQIGRLRKALMQLKFDDNFIQETTGGGKNSPGPLARRISMVEKVVEEVL